MSHHCAVCDKPIGPAYLMCASHWHMVPQTMKTEVFRTWGDLRRFGRMASPQRAAKLLADYEQTRRAAIDHVEARLAGNDQPEGVNP